MKYWPLSTILNDPAFPSAHRVALLNYRIVGVSQETFQACRDITNQSRGYDIFMTYTEGKPLHRSYLERPTMENFAALERAVFVDTGLGFAFNVATVH